MCTMHIFKFYIVSNCTSYTNMMCCIIMMK